MGTGARRRRLVAAVTGSVLGLLLLTAAPAAGVATPADPSPIARFLAGARERTGVPGLAAAVTRGPDVVETLGLGTDGRGAPVTADTPFRVASLSKSFTAAAVLRLVDDGRVALDRPVRDYLPDFAPAGPGAERITARHLLNQTGGLSDGGYPGLVRDRPADPAGRVLAMRGARTAGEPGGAFHYTDVNYQVLARLVEVADGRPFPAALHDLVLAPLGMARTVTVVRSAEADVPPGHVLVYGRAVTCPEPDGLLAGSGGVVTTASDMARWLVWQSTGRPGLLRPATFALMHAPVRDGYAMGWQRGPGGRLEHDGVLATFSAQQVLLPDGGAFALLYDANAPLADTAAVREGVAALLAGRAPVAPRSTALVASGIGVVTLLALAGRVWQVRRVPRWRSRWAGRPWPSRVPGVVLPVVPLAVLLALPALLLATIGRRFTLAQLTLAMPEVVVLLAVAGVGGLVAAVCRAVGASRGPGAPGSGGHLGVVTRGREPRRPPGSAARRR